MTTTKRETEQDQATCLGACRLQCEHPYVVDRGDGWGECIDCGVWTGQPEEPTQPWQGWAETWKDYGATQTPRCKSCGNPRDLLAHSPEEVLCVLCADMAAGRMGWYKRWGLDITMSPPQPQGSLKDDEV